MNKALAWPQGYSLRHYGEIDSTNDEARRLASAGEAGPLWLAAERQTKGRGRRGREWHSAAGNLFATLLIRPRMPIAQCAQLSFVAALAVTGLVGRYAPGAEIRVKWPNDVLADGNKIAGILLESASNNGDRLDWLALGFGVNLVSHPVDAGFPATSVAALGAGAPTAGDALICLAAMWARWYGLWVEQGFGPIRDSWLARAARLGARIHARLANGETTGVFEGIDESGALLLREMSHHVRVISAAEVFF